MNLHARHTGMFKVGLQSALFNPDISDSFDAAPPPRADPPPHRRASGALSHALKSCDSVKGSLWRGGGASSPHTVLSRLLAGVHFFFIEMSLGEKAKEERQPSSDSHSLFVECSLKALMHMKLVACLITVYNLQMSKWKHYLQ